MALTYGILDGEYSADQFSEMFIPMVSDAVTDFGNRFALNLRSGLSVRVSSGYAYVFGHWIKNDEPEVITLELSDGERLRYDAIVLTLNENERTAGLELLTDVDPDNLAVEGLYIYPLYIIRVRAGAVTLYDEDIEDKREILTQLNLLSGDALSSYNYINNGIDNTVTEFVQRIDQSVTLAENAIHRIDAAVDEKKSIALGTIVYAMTSPLTSDKWLLCNGSPIPATYPDLIALIGSSTPIINFSDARFHSYIYAGAPV